MIMKMRPLVIVPMTAIIILRRSVILSVLYISLNISQRRDRPSIGCIPMQEITMKKCSRCGQALQFSMFSKKTASKDGLHHYCRPCATIVKREWLSKKEDLSAYYKAVDLKRHYNLSMEDYNDLLEECNSCCCICKCEFSDVNRANVDHCHNTGLVRGLLCNNCNNGLGRFMDDPDILDAAADYLRSYI